MAIFSALVAGAAAAVQSVVAAVAGSAFLTQVAGQLVVGALLTGASLLFSRQPKFTPPTQAYQATISQATALRRRFYGRNRVSGVRAWFETGRGYLHQIIMFASQEVAQIEGAWIGDKPVSTDASGNVTTSPFAGAARILTRAGTADQAALSEMTAAFPTFWTANHRLRGIAYGWVRMFSQADSLPQVWPESYNTPFRWTIRAAKVYDPRDAAQSAADPSTWVYSDNAALCILDYLTHPDGFGESFEEIDSASFAAMADVCDQDVALKGGGTEKRYRLWGGYEFNDDPVEVLGRLLATCDGELYETAEGKIAIRGGRWQAPTVTIPSESILALASFTTGSDAIDRFNRLKIIYTSEIHDWQPTEAPAWNDNADQALRGVEPKDLTLDMVPSHAQAQRLAKIVMARNNPAWKGVITTNLAGLDAIGEAVIRVRIDRLGIDETFAVGRITIGDATVTIEISSLAETAFAWNPAIEEGDPAPAPQVTAPAVGIETPQNTVVTVETRSINGGTPSAAIVITADAPSRADLRLEVEYVRVSDGLAQIASAPLDVYTVEAGPLVDGAEYDVRARWKIASVPGPYTSPAVRVAAVANPTAPAAPTSFTATLASSDVDLQWTNPSSNFYRARVYRGTTTVLAEATMIAELAGTAGGVQSYIDVSPPAGTTLHYWVSARNESNIEGAAAGPQSVSTPSP